MRKRTKNEVFTPLWCAKRMIKQDANYYKDIFLEPTAGDGNFIVAIAEMKLNYLKKNSLLTTSNILKTINNIYGIEIFKDNVKKAKKRFFSVLKSYVEMQQLSLDDVNAIKSIIKNNIVQGNTLTFKNAQNQPLIINRLRYNKVQGRVEKTSHNLKICPSRSNQNDIVPNYIIGNPPYNVKNHTKNNISYSQVFNYFVENSIDLKPHYMSMIIPNRWFSGGKNLSKFRRRMLNDKHIKSMNIWKSSKSLFPKVAINGGVNYFLWDKNYDNKNNEMNVKIWNNRKVISNQNRPLKIGDTDIFIADPLGVNILQKIQSNLKNNSLYKHISSSCPFTLRPYYPKRSIHWHKAPVKNGYKCYAGNNKIGYVKKDVVNQRLQKKHSKQKYIPTINKYKLITVGANGIGISKNDALKVKLVEPNAICTETYIILGWDLRLSVSQLRALKKYVQTKFVRFLISLHKSSQHAVRSVYKLVPVPDLYKNSKIDWNEDVKGINKQLEDYYNLSTTERQHIDNTIHVEQ